MKRQRGREREGERGEWRERRVKRESGEDGEREWGGWRELR